MGGQLPRREVGHAGHPHVLHGRGELEGVRVLGVRRVAVLGGLHLHLGQQSTATVGVFIMLGRGGRV